MTKRKLKKLFLAQSYLDSWDEYQRSLRKSSYITWDYVILTASNEEQALAYEQQILDRLALGLLPEKTVYKVLPDPDGKRVGSGGATFNVLKYIAQQDGDARENHFRGKRILVIHSGGDSKRVPQYSACGKLFSPVPRELPNGRPSTLFDEFIIGMTSLAGRFPDGMVVLSGDVLLLFNPLQIDLQYHGAAAISIKEDVETGKNHGVFLNDGHDHVARCLQKQSVETLRAAGAVNENDAVDIDTGAVVLDAELLNALFSLISTDGVVCEEKFHKFVNETARVSFYADFLYPLAGEATLDDFQRETPEGSFCEELTECRNQIWEALHAFSMKLICLSPAEFIHFGTTRELRELVTVGVDDYEFLGWQKCVLTNMQDADEYATNNAYIASDAVIGQGSYIEDSYIGPNTVVGAGTIISNAGIENVTLPENMVFHTLALSDGTFVTRVYGTEDNPKGTYEKNSLWIGIPIQNILAAYNILPEQIWNRQERYLWFADLYTVEADRAASVASAMRLCRIVAGTAKPDDVNSWLESKRLSLCSSFNAADVRAIVPWKRKIENQVLVTCFVDRLMQGEYYEDALRVFGDVGINEAQYQLLMERAEHSAFSEKIRIYYALSRYMRNHRQSFAGAQYDALESKCFDEIQRVIYENGKDKIPDFDDFHIAKEEVHVSLPVRVNWGGGWTDTPPHCNEKGGVVLNAAIKLKGNYPIQVTMHRIPELEVQFESQDIGVSGVAKTVEEIQDCHNPYDFFALHKAALIACGIIPIEGHYELTDILEKLGDGFYLSTQVIGVPKGSGLGTSSILSGACVKAIFEFFGQEVQDAELYDIVLCMEQIMSTGGGWQDQVGGVTAGVKMITTEPGINQVIQVENVVLSEATKKELQERFALIYTGQRRLARNLLRDVVGGYIGGRKESTDALDQMQRTAALMQFELERGNVDRFAALLNEHWELSKQLDAGSTNTCIDQIFLACEDLVDGQFISGAGGGGFLQVILKKGVTREQLHQRLYSIFQDSGVDVWDTEFIWE